MQLEIKPSKRKYNAATQAQESLVTADILDRLEEIANSIKTITTDCQNERDENLLQQEFFCIAIEKIQMQVEKLDLRLQESVDSLKTRINCTDNMITMFEKNQSILMDVIDKQALELQKFQSNNSR